MISPLLRCRLVPRLLVAILLTVGVAPVAFAEVLGALGHLKPEVSVLTVVGPPGPAAVAKIHVAENATVDAGDLLMTLSTHEGAQSDLEQARAHLERVKLQAAHSIGIQALEVKRQKDVVAQATRAKEQSSDISENRIKVSQLKVKQVAAQENLARTNLATSGKRGPQLIQEQVLQVRDAELGLGLAEARLLSYKQLDGGSIAPREMELREYQVQQAKLNLEASQVALKRIESESASAKDRAAAELLNAEASLEMAKAELTQEQSNAPMSAANAEQDLTSATILVEIAEARLAQIKGDAETATVNAEAEVSRAETALKASEVRAPYPGTVVEIIAGIGDLATSRPLIRFADLSRMVVDCEVYEGDLMKVKVGHTATVSSAALPKEIKGEVISVSRLIDNRLRIGRVKVRLTEADAASRLLNHEVSVKINL